MSRIVVVAVLLATLAGVTACSTDPEPVAAAPTQAALPDPVLDRVAGETDCAALDGVFTIAKAGRDRATSAADMQELTARMVAATTRMAALSCPQ